MMGQPTHQYRQSPPPRGMARGLESVFLSACPCVQREAGSRREERVYPSGPLGTPRGKRAQENDPSLLAGAGIRGAGKKHQHMVTNAKAASLPFPPHSYPSWDKPPEPGPLACPCVLGRDWLEVMATVWAFCGEGGGSDRQQQLFGA